MITDATREAAHHYVNKWRIKYKFNLKNYNEDGWRYEVIVDPAVISATQVGKDQLKEEMTEYIAEDRRWVGASVHEFTANSMTVDIPRGGAYQVMKQLSDVDYLKELQEDFKRNFRNTLAIRRYYVDPADVDTIAGLGNYIEITTTQALNQIKDRLAE